MPTDVAIIRGIGVAWLRPLTFTSGDISGVGTEIPFDYLKSTGLEWPADAAASSTSFIEALVAEGITVQYAKLTTVYDGVTGLVKAGGSGGATNKARIVTYEVGKTMLAAVAALVGADVQVCIPLGENVTTAEEGFAYMLGKVSSGISYDAAGETVVELAIEITGQSYTATGGGDTALITGFADITKLDGSTVSPTDLTAGADVTALKAGGIVIK